MCQSATFLQPDERIKTALSWKISLSTPEFLRGRRHSGNSDGHLLHPFSGNGNISEDGAIGGSARIDGPIGASQAA